MKFIAYYEGGGVFFLACGGVTSVMKNSECRIAGSDYVSVNEKSGSFHVNMNTVTYKLKR